MTTPAPFAVGDRVVCAHPDDELGPLVGTVCEVRPEAVLVRYDAYPATAHPGVIATEQASSWLIPEENYRARRWARQPWTAP